MLKKPRRCGASVTRHSGRPKIWRLGLLLSDGPASVSSRHLVDDWDGWSADDQTNRAMCGWSVFRAMTSLCESPNTSGGIRVLWRSRPGTGRRAGTSPRHAPRTL
eukprot:7092712-Alexandrium_andersonii.AAC.1